jgi:hypothetical protein
VSDRIKDMVGRVVSDDEVASGLGFKSVEDFRAWWAAGSPSGRCSNPHCWRPAFWPDLEKPCRHCGSPIEVDVPGERNE